MALDPTNDLLVFQSLWGFAGDLDQAINRAAAYGFDGLEGNLRHPALQQMSPAAVVERFAAAGLHLIIELVSGGDYVPDLSLFWQEHIGQLDRDLHQAETLRPLRINLIAGSDSWSDAVQDQFLEGVLDRLALCPIPVSLETHRSRSLFNPWSTGALLKRHGRLRLTADISHWCAVSERLMTPELEPIQAIADRVDHIHARVGHAQGPSVGHPFAPEWAEALEAHRRCWHLFVERQCHRSHTPTTITPEFGPDGYLPCLPFTAMPVADLDDINAQMGRWLRRNVMRP